MGHSSSSSTQYLSKIFHLTSSSWGLVYSSN